MKVYIGKLVNTHGLKGEVRIISDFKYKDIVFKINNELIIDNKSYKITGYRKHKMYDMVTLSGINNIDDALTIKGFNVYIDSDNYKFDEYLDEELIGLSVYYNGVLKGKVVDVYKAKKDDLLVIDGKKRHMVPNRKEFIKNIDINNNRIDIEYIGGLDLED